MRSNVKKSACVLVVVAGIAIQLIPIFPMAVKPTSLPNTLIAVRGWPYVAQVYTCLLYTSDAADE